MLVAAILMVPLVLASPAAAQTSGCGEPVTDKSPQKLASPLKLKLVDPKPQDTTMEFGRGRDPQRLELRPQIEGNTDATVIESPVFIDLGLFKGEGKQIPKNQIVVERAETNNTGSELIIQICIDPTGLDAGLYQGSMRVDDSRFGLFEVPITVSLQFRTWVLPLAFGLVVAGVAAAGAVLSAALQDGWDSQLLKRNWVWLLVAAVVGAFVGIVVFVNTFEKEKAWDGDMSAFLALALAAVTAGYTMSILPILGRAFTRRGDEAGKTKKLQTKKDDEETDDDQDPAVVIDDTDAATTDEAETVETGAAD
jgi:hypothetical protein